MNTTVEPAAYERDALAQRLLRLDIATPGALFELTAEHGDSRRPVGRAHRRRRAYMIGAAAAAVSVAVIATSVMHFASSGSITRYVPGYTIEAAAATSATPRMSRAQAVSVAMAALAAHAVRSSDGVAFTGFTVTQSTFEPGVLKVWHDCGAHWFMNSPENLWVVDMDAPAQAGWRYVQASVLIDDSTGAARYADARIAHQVPEGCGSGH